MGKTSKKGKGFEDRLVELEAIVARLEEGDVSLEESLELFQKGTDRIKELSRMLNEAERKVEVITRDSSGSLKAGPFDEEREEE